MVVSLTVSMISHWKLTCISLYIAVNITAFLPKQPRIRPNASKINLAEKWIHRRGKDEKNVHLIFFLCANWIKKYVVCRQSCKSKAKMFEWLKWRFLPLAWRCLNFQYMLRPKVFSATIISCKDFQLNSVQMKL